MFNALRRLCERALRLPPEPAPPPGDEGTARVFRAAPNYFKYLVLQWALSSAVIIFPALTLESVPVKAFQNTAPAAFRKAAPWLVPLLVLSFVLVVLSRFVALAIQRLDFEKRWYVVTDRSLRIREGVLNVHEMTITFANIQNLSITQGPLERLLHITNLEVETAGGGASEHGHQKKTNLHRAQFRGIDNATEVKTLIQERLRALKDSGLGDQEKLPATPVPKPASSSTLNKALRLVLVEAQALRKSLS